MHDVAYCDDTSRTAQDTRTPPGQASLLPGLIVVLLLCCIAFVKVLPQDPVLYAALMHPFIPSAEQERELALQRVREDDPKLGTVLENPSKPSGQLPPILGPNHAGGPTLVLMIGACSPCVLSTLQAADRLHAANPRLGVVAVSRSTARELSDFRSKYKIRIPITSDPDARLATRYNAAWSPRAYLLGPHGALLWLQYARTLDDRYLADHSTLKQVLGEVK